MLHLLPRLEVIASGRRLRTNPDSKAAAEAGQGGVGHPHTFRLQLLQDPDPIALAELVEFPDPVLVRA